MSKDRLQTLKAIKNLIATKHVNVAADAYADWAETLDRSTPELLSASPLEFQSAVHGLLSDLRTSHTAFLKPDTETIPLRHALCATVRRHETPLVDRWIFQDVIEDGPAHIAGIRPGDVLIAKDGVEVDPPACPTFGFGGTYSLTTGRLGGPESTVLSVTVPNKPAKDRPPMIEPKAISFFMAEGNVPVIKVSTFPGAVGLPFAHELDRIVDTLTREKRDRLIIDLRGNIGGGLASLRLMSYLCPDRRPIGYSLTKRHLQRSTSPAALPKIRALPESKASQLAMLVKFRFIHKDRSVVLETEGLGARPFHGRIAILTNEHTHSAAEMVAAFAKENGLATLIGTQTAGEVMGGANFSVGEGYRLRIPVTTWQTWRGTVIEGVGVSPDISVDFFSATSNGSGDPQLETAIQIAMDGSSQSHAKSGF